MSYDLIIVSQSNERLIPVTQQCIDTARQDDTELNIIIVETGNPYKYDVDKLIEYNGEFNYNRALNMGLKYACNKIHILANNDIIFHEGWSAIGELMESEGLHSASALSGHLANMFKVGDYVYEGYNVSYLLTGWCLFMDDYVIEKIGKLDETCSFWFSDNLYALQLQEAGIKHGLFTGIRIDHIASQTLNKQPTRLQRKYQVGELHKYNKRVNHYAKAERMRVVNR